jgi:nucleotide-binding universal stress UspA family protein
MFSKILVPVDGSESSYKALETALFLGGKLGSNITVMHVMEDIPVTHIQSQKLLKTLTEISMVCKKQGQDILSKCSEIATQKGLNIKTLLFKGNPASVILDYTLKEEHDSIIMGRRGMGKFKELFLGSVSSKVLHHSTCPVMIIR